MFKVTMDGYELGCKFEGKKFAQNYVKGARAVDKAHGEKHVYKIIEKK